MQDEAIAPLPPLVPRSRVLVVDGYGIQVRVSHRHLVVEDGIGRDRRQLRLARATAGIKRLVLLGHEGFLTLEALRWLGDIGAALIQIDRDGYLVAAFGPQGNNDPRLRRAQALAQGAPMGNAIVRDILRAKLEGQGRVLDRLGSGEESRAAIASALEALEDASSAQELMVQEAAAAAAYWDAWACVELPMARADRSKVPDHWLRFGRRASSLTVNPRLATNPANAILNYLYGLLEAECRIACLAVGLDPGLGVLHADQRNRESMALDAMEAVRPEVDAYVVDLLQGHVFRARDFHETREGSCRLLAPLTHSLSETLPMLRRSVGPIVERVGRTLMEGQTSTTLPTPITQDNRSAGRDGIRRKQRRAPGVRTAKPARACRFCGVILEEEERRYCDVCLPKQKTEALAGASERATAKLASLRAQGKDPAHGGEAARKRAESLRKREAEARTWKGERPNPAEFGPIRLALRGVPVRRIATATGLTRAYVAAIKRGSCVPHPRWWSSFLELAEQGRSRTCGAP